MPDAEDGTALTVEPFGDALTPRAKSPREVQSALKGLIDDAETFRLADLTPGRVQSTEYYQGQPFRDPALAPKPGRSQVIATEERDTVLAILPSLLRIFFGADRAVEYVPVGQEDIAAADQATEYVNRVVLQQDNPGFLIFHSWFKDALIRNPGVVKYWWEDQTTVQAEMAYDISTEQLELLASDETVQLTRIQSVSHPVPLPDGTMGELLTHTVEFRRTQRDGRVRIACLPPEEFGWSRNARSLTDAAVVYHRTELTRSDLLALGIPEAVIDQHGGTFTGVQQSEEATARNRGVSQIESPADESTERHLYIEAYPYLDVDGDGIAELRKVCCLGSGMYVVNGDGLGEPCPERPFAALIPDPEPHTVLGQDVADWTMDLQRLKSSLLRAILDSLAQSIFPAKAYVEGAVHPADILSSAIGQPIRVTRDVPPNQVLQEFAHDFHGAKALPLLDVVDRIKEDRVGRARGAGGIDADALQSSTKAAVAATVTATHERLEMIARIFAETGIKDLFRGLLRLLNRHQPAARMVRLRNQWTPVDPRAWNAEMDVQVNVALGAGLPEEKLAILAATAQDQQAILTTLGPTNPLVTLGQYRYTRAKMLELQGFRDTTRFYQDVPLDWQPPPTPPSPDPAQILAQAEALKAEAQARKAQADAAMDAVEIQRKTLEADAKAAARQEELALRREEMLRVDAREREKLAADTALRQEELRLKYEGELAKAQLAADLDRERAHTDAEAKVRAAKEGKKITIRRERAE